MNKSPGISPLIKVATILLTILLMLGINIGCSTQTAHATEYVPVSSNDFVARNPLTIQERTDPPPVQVKSSTTTVRTSSTVDDPNRNTYGDPHVSLAAYHTWDYRENEDINYVRKYTYSGMGDGAMVTDRCSTGAVLEFTDLTTVGDSGSVTVEYPVVGVYDKRDVGARVTYAVSYNPSRWEHWWETDVKVRPITTNPFGYPVLCLSDSFYNGVRQVNTSKCDVSITFFNADTGQDIAVQGGWIALNSLNYTTPTSISGYIVTGSEQVTVPENKTSKIEYRDDGDIKTVSSNGYITAYSYRVSPDFEDRLREETFTKQSAVIYQEDCFEFTIRGTQTPAGNWKYNVWWTPTSSSIANQVVDDPQKSVDKNEANPGDTLTYTIKQKVNTLGVDGVTSYSSMSLIDRLPPETCYVTDSAKVYKVKNDTTTELPPSAGSFAYDTETNSLTYSFTNSYLEKMELEGETYMVVFNAQLNEATSNLIENTAVALINGYEFNSNTVRTLVNKPKLSLNKTVDSYDRTVGDYANYTLTVSNTEAGTWAKDVLISDVSLPSSLSLDASSIEVSGIPEQVIVKTVEGNNTSDETVPNTYRIEPSGNTFKITVDYLPANTEISVTYRALIKEAAVGTEMPNTATVAASNADPVQDSAYIWANSAKLSFDKKASAYEWGVGNAVEYTLTLTNDQSGTIAKNIVVDETSLPEGLAVNFDSINVTGAPTSLDFPVSHEETQSLINSHNITKSGAGFVFTLDYLPSDSTVIITFTALAHEDNNGFEVVNRAHASCENPVTNHPNPVEASDVIWINSPGLTPIKTSSDITYKVGDIVKYKIVVTNEAAGTVARNVIIADLFETKDIEIERASIIVSDAAGNRVTDQCKITQNANEQGFEIHTPFTLVNPSFFSVYDGIPFEQDILNPLGITQETELTVEYTAQILSNELAGKEIVNQVVTASDEGPGGADDDRITVNGPLLKIDKSTSSTLVKPNETITYQLSVTQLREGMTAKNVVVDDACNAIESSIVEGSVSVLDTEFNDITGACSITATDVLRIETYRDLTDADTLYIEYQLSVSELTESELINTAGASADNTGRVIDKERIPAATQSPAILLLTKSSDPEAGAKVVTGQEITYYLTMTNSGSLPARNIGINDLVPTNTTFTEIQGDHSGSYFEDTNSVGWLIEELAPGKSVTVGFKTIVTEKVTADTPIENYATYATDQTEIPKTSLENNSNTVIHPIEEADLKVIKSSDSTEGTKVFTGQEITYYLTVLNSGGSRALGIGINDAVPMNTLFIEIQSEHAGTYFKNTNSVGWLIEELAPGESVTVGFRVKVVDGVSAGTAIKNYATYAPDQTKAPDKALDNNTNSVIHPVDKNTSPSNSGSGSPYDKLGVNQIAPLCIMLGLGLLAIGSLLYALRKRSLDK